MTGNKELTVIARMQSDFTTKFGLPRQSGLVDEIRGRVVLEKEYSDPAAFRGIENFSHIWLIWGFSEAEPKSKNGGWSPTVRPPRLGGNKRMGVFATRSPFRPNRLGLSCVRLCGVIREAGSISLEVAGADLMDGTPIYDIKPYLPYTDAHTDAVSGFAPAAAERVRVEIPAHIADRIPQEKLEALVQVLEQDPRPAYQKESSRVYAFEFSDFHIEFTATQDCITVCEITKK